MILVAKANSSNIRKLYFIYESNLFVIELSQDLVLSGHKHENVVHI